MTRHDEGRLGKYAVILAVICACFNVAVCALVFLGWFASNPLGPLRLGESIITIRTDPALSGRLVEQGAGWSWSPLARVHSYTMTDNGHEYSYTFYNGILGVASVTNAAPPGTPAYSTSGRVMSSNVDGIMQVKTESCVPKMIKLLMWIAIMFAIGAPRVSVRGRRSLLIGALAAALIGPVFMLGVLMKVPILPLCALVAVWMAILLVGFWVWSFCQLKCGWLRRLLFLACMLLSVASWVLVW